MNKRIKFTEREPIFFPADSKAKAVAVQQKAAIKLANSPKYESSISFPLLNQVILIFFIFTQNFEPQRNKKQVILIHLSWKSLISAGSLTPH